MRKSLAPAGSLADNCHEEKILAEKLSSIYNEKYRAKGLTRSYRGLANFLHGIAARPKRFDRDEYGLTQISFRNVFDHARMYNRHGKPHCVISHPYELALEEMTNFTAWCAKVGLTMTIDGRSEYYPAATVRLTVWREDTLLFDDGV